MDLGQVTGCDKASRLAQNKRGKEKNKRSVADPFVPAESELRMNETKIKQRFSFRAPGAHRVLLAGDFTGWMKNPIALRKQSGELWEAFAWLDPGTHHYRFVVDGEWKDDPECTLRVQNPYGTQNAVIRVDAIAGKTQGGRSIRSRATV
jgi:1,4-alpha-glucan branching enzyme